MPGMSLVGLDTAGGIILGGGQDFVSADDALVSVVGDKVAPHPGHITAQMVQGNSFVTINGIPIVHAGDRASCDHQATGQAWITIDP